MVSIYTGLSKLTSTLCQTNNCRTLYQPQTFIYLVQSARTLFVQSYLYRARRGTRERKLKMLKKRKAQKAASRIREQIERMQFLAKQRAATHQSKRINDSDRIVSPDDVWFADHFKLRSFSFEDAVLAHREIHHPSLFNEPSSLLHAFVELDMTTDKKTKFFEGFSNVVSVDYPYPHNEDRSILVFCRTREQMDDCLEAGASLAGGEDIIKQVKRGKITLPDFHFIIAHPNIVQDLLVIRGLLRNKFPEVEKGSLGNNLVNMIANIKKGIKYETKKDDFEQSYGWADVPLGPLDWDIAHLESNLRAVLIDIRDRGPIRTKKDENYKFMTRCYITTPLHQEKLLIPMEKYMEEAEIVDSDDEDDEVSENVIL